MIHRHRKLHPADVRDAEVIANAVRFDLALFLGTGRYARASATTLDEIAQAAARLTLEHRNGRTPMIYAIDATGRSAFVTHQLPQESKMQKTYAKKFNAQRAAKAAGHNLDAIEITKTKAGFIWSPKVAKPEPKTEPDAPSSKSASAAAKPAKAPARRTGGKRGAIEEAARGGKLPSPPDFSAATHARFRGKLAKLVELAKAGDIGGLNAVEINPVSTSPKALVRYRDLCVLALRAKQPAAT